NGPAASGGRSGRSGEAGGQGAEVAAEGQVGPADALAADLEPAPLFPRRGGGEEVHFREKGGKGGIRIAGDPLLDCRNDRPAPLFKGGNPVDAAVDGRQVKPLEV